VVCICLQAVLSGDSGGVNHIGAGEDALYEGCVSVGNIATIKCNKVTSLV
jgi:hypothetical protein